MYYLGAKLQIKNKSQDHTFSLHQKEKRLGTKALRVSQNKLIKTIIMFLQTQTYTVDCLLLYTWYKHLNEEQWLNLLLLPQSFIDMDGIEPTSHTTIS